MGSLAVSQMPHAVCVPFPAQGHINPFLKVAKFLHSRGFHITFVLTEYNYNRLLRSRGPQALKGLPSFQFDTIPDGLPPSDADSTQSIPDICYSTERSCTEPLKELIAKLNRDAEKPPVSCIVSDFTMFFTLRAAEEFGIPNVMLWTASACGLLGYAQYERLIDEGLTPLKDESYMTNGYLDTPIDWAPEAMKGIRLRDIPSFVRTTDPDEFMLKFVVSFINETRKASAVLINSYDSLDRQVLKSLETIYPSLVYSIGPLPFILDQINDDQTKSITTSLWREDPKCLEWLDSKDPSSVVYVNFGSITVMTNDQLLEFAWGLANSNKQFLWIIRPDLVTGDNAVLPLEFSTETRDRGLIASWCDQEQVLSHPAVGGFLTHCGWNSNLESLCNGVPMVCWPFFAEQQTNCWYCCNEWGVGMEIDPDVKRDVVAKQVTELMDGEKGKELKNKAMEWMRLAKDAADSTKGYSYLNLNRLITDVLLAPKAQLNVNYKL